MNKFFVQLSAIFLLASMLIFNPLRVKSQVLSFPGAEGFGRNTTGGRGGVVYEVTNLNDSGTGSFRDACSKTGPRTIVFRVSGTINLLSKLTIRTGDLTIAGQTAPGDGICVSGYNFFIGASNVIVRYMRFRLGNINVAECECDAFGGEEMTNIMIDHCSMSWSIDETGSFYDNTKFTMQWCIISESLYNSGHVKGNHGYGGIQGGCDASFHHNLYASHTSRNPRFSGGRYYETSANKENVDFRNNVIFNWGFNSVYGGELGQQNMINNYYKAGPATKTGVKNRIVDINRGSETDPGKWYITGNYVTGFPAITADNWAGGVQGNDANTPGVRMTTPFTYDPVTTQTAEEAYVSVLDKAGAILPKRDPVDARIINETKSGVCAFGDTYDPQTGMSLSHTGIINSQESVGGWPSLFSAPAPLDTDKDGMPDGWESANNLNPNDPTDRNTIGAGGYTMLEIYLNGIGGFTTYSLTTSTSTGIGTVSPTGITSYNSGTIVNVAATPGVGYKFINWVDGSGNALGSTNPVSITMNGDKTVKANFAAAATYTLTTTKAGSGTGTVTYNPPAGIYTEGSIVTVNSSPATNSSFSGWSGAVSGFQSSVTITMDANKSIIATFNLRNPNDKKIAYVTDPAVALYLKDTQILPALKAEQGFSVTEFDVSKITNDYTTFDLIILSEVCGSASAGVIPLKGLDKPFLYMKPKSYITGAWGWTASTSSNGYDASQKNIVVSNLGHAIFNWPYPISMINTNEVQVLSSVTNSKGLTYMDPASFTTTSSSSISSIAIVKGSSGTAQSSILEIPVNTVISGTTVLQKFVQIGYAADSYSNVTMDGVKIILNACYYLMGMSKPTAIKSISALDEKICFTLLDNTLIIDFPDTAFGNAIINIYTVSGQKVYSGTRPVNPYGRIEVNLGMLKSGLYFCNIQNKNRATTWKFIKL